MRRMCDSDMTGRKRGVILCLLVTMELFSLLVTSHGKRAHRETAIVTVLNTWSHVGGGHNNSRFPDQLELLIQARSRKHFLFLHRNLHIHRLVPVMTSRGRSFDLRDRFEDKTSAFYQSARSAGSLSWTIYKNGSELFTGSFETADFMYTLEPVYGNTSWVTHYWLTRSSHRPWRRSVVHKDDLLEPHKSNRDDQKNRTKRQKQLYEIELLVVTDLSVNSFKSLTPEAEVNVIPSLIDRFTLLVNGMDARFKNIQHQSGYVIHVTLAGIYITDSNNTPPWAAAVQSRIRSRDVLSEEALYLFSDWLKSNNIWRQFDHAMGITGYNVAYEGSTKTLGLGYKQSMCTNKSISIIEDHGNLAYVTYIATHELAHSLGSRHDGDPEVVTYDGTSRTCHADDKFIMSPKTSSDPALSDSLRRWRFSPCSWLYFDFYIHHLDSNSINCMTKKARLTSQFNVRAHVPDVYIPDIQCTHAHGTGSVMSREEVSNNSQTICASIPCTLPGKPSVTIATLAMEGTKCGAHHVCATGVCQETSREREQLNSLQESCLFDDQPGSVTTSKATCEDLIPSTLYAYLCYTFGVICCRTCAQYKREYTSLPNCTYGNRKEECDVTHCGNDDCCETCAVLTTCPPLQLPSYGNMTTNTGHNHHGSVASISCSQGYRVNGHATITCLENGTWSAESPTCRHGCPNLTMMSHVVAEVVKGNNSVGSVVKFVCDHGFTLVGNARLVCQNNSLWNGTPPYCELDIASSARIGVLENTKAGTTVHHLSTGSAPAIFKLTTYSHPGFVVTERGDVIVSSGYVIDFEANQNYYLTVQAVSRVDQTMVAHQSLTIAVKDLNEFDPEFNQSIYCVSVIENPSADFRLVQLQASDRDGSGSNITYKLLHDPDTTNVHHDSFYLDERNGAIWLRQHYSSAKRLTVSSSQMIAIAIDSGYPWQRTGSATVLVHFGEECPQNSSRSEVLSFVVIKSLTLLYYMYDLFT